MDRSADRARRHTARSVLRRIDDDTLDHLMEVAQKPETTSRRLEALDREWDIDRTIEVEAATMGLIGLALGAFVRPAFLAMPATVGAAVFLFGTRGMYPLLPIFRRLGIRTAREIERERYAVKSLRGDFDSMPQEQQPASGTDDVDRTAPMRH
jgi:phage tail tape-measure protein